MKWQHSIGEEKAIKISRTKWWKGKSDKDIVTVQLFLVECVMPFNLFLKKFAEALGRKQPLENIELGYFCESLKDKFLNGQPEPSLMQISNILPPRSRKIFK